jgi:DNA-binding MarR family transcriptional regulator
VPWVVEKRPASVALRSLQNVHILPIPCIARYLVKTADASATACVCGRLRRASRALTQMYDDAMAPSGMRITQFSLVRTLAREGPMRITDLAGLVLLDRTALSRTLEPLVEHGWVKVTPGRDARTREASLTRAGKLAFERAVPHWEEAQKVVRRKLGAPRIEALVELLTSVETLHPAPAGNEQ